MGHTGSHPEPYLCLELPWRYTAFGVGLCNYLAEQNLHHPIPICWRETEKPVNPNKQSCDKPVSVSPRKLTRLLERGNDQQRT